jgi:hypothetical protein
MQAEAAAGAGAPAERCSLVDWAASRLGTGRLVARDVSWDHAESHVLALSTAPGRPPLAFLKVYRQPRKYRCERAALRDWGRLVPATPAILAQDGRRPCRLLLTALPGEPAHAFGPERHDLPALHWAAGRWLRRLHALRLPDGDPLPLAVALRLRVDAVCRRSPQEVPDATLRWLRAELGALDLPGPRRVACHRDFGPRNWLWSERSGLSVIDFEHARPDLWLADVLALVDGPWHGRADLAAAFWDGYGRALRVDESDALTALRALRAVGTVGWARRHGDAAFEARGWRILRRLEAPGVT